MLRLDSTVVLQAVLGGAVATTQPQATVCASDHTSPSTYAGLAPVRTALNSTTDVTILAAPVAGTIRDVDYISIYNRDTAAVTITIKYDQGGIDTIIAIFTLQTLETLQFIHGHGWACFDKNGFFKSTFAGAILAATSGGTGFGTYTIGDLLYADTSSTLAKLADVAAGSYLRSGGVGTAPLWSTATLPNTATTGDLLYASAANVYSNLAGVATGNALISGGVGVPPSWGKIGLTTHVSGVLPVVNGGTNGLPFSIPGGRLTLTSGTPVMTATASAQTTIFYALYTTDQVPLYDGTNWFNTTFTELSQTTTDTTKSPAAVANNSNYDMFVWTDSGTIRCTRGPAWTSDTARGTGAGTTELVRQNGVWLNNVAVTNGPGAKRGTYVGTVRSNGTATIDWKLGGTAATGSSVFLYLWNAYNRVNIVPWSQDSSVWSYNSTTKRAMDGSNNNRLSFVRGLDEEEIAANLQITFTGGAAGDYVFAISLDSTNTVTQSASYGSFGSFTAPGHAVWSGIPGLGAHFLQSIEYQLTTGTAATGVGTVTGQTGFVQLRGTFRC